MMISNLNKGNNSQTKKEGLKMVMMVVSHYNYTLLCNHGMSLGLWCIALGQITNAMLGLVHLGRYVYHISQYLRVFMILHHPPLLLAAPNILIWYLPRWTRPDIAFVICPRAIYHRPKPMPLLKSNA
jgi:hypothetical protein